jgi:hypothetical protein
MTRHGRPDRLAVLGIGAAAVALACCAGLPLLVGALAGVSVAAVAGVGLGIVAFVVAVGVVLGALRARRRSCDSDEASGGLTG